MREILKRILNTGVCGHLLLVLSIALSGTAAEKTSKPFNARIQRKSGRWLSVQVLGITNQQFALRMEGAEMRVKIKDLRGFRWVSPTPVEIGEKLISSNRFAAVLTRLTEFSDKEFLTPQLPAALQRDAIVKLIADAYIGLKRLQDASDIMAYISEDADVIIRRLRIHKALEEYDAAIELARKYTGSPDAQDSPVKAKPAQTTAAKIRWSDLESANLYYELGTSLQARKDYEAALDELLKVKVLYRADMDLVAQCELRAVECYRGLHKYLRAARVLSNIVNNADYSVVKPEAEAALNTVLLEFEKEKELKRRIGGE